MIQITLGFESYLKLIEPLISLSCRLRLDMTEDDPIVAEFNALRQYLISRVSLVDVSTMNELARYDEKHGYTTIYYDGAKMVTRGKIRVVVLYPAYTIDNGIVKIQYVKPISPVAVQEIHALFRSIDLQFSDAVSNYRTYIPKGRSEEQRLDAQRMLDKIVTNDTGYMTGIIGILEWKFDHPRDHSQ